MGKPQSKTVSQSGDAQVNVLNALDIHTEWHVGHDTKLNILLVIVTTSRSQSTGCTPNTQNPKR